MVGSRAQNLKDEYENSWDSTKVSRKGKWRQLPSKRTMIASSFAKYTKQILNGIDAILTLKPSRLDFGEGFQVKICFLFLIGSTVVFCVETVSWSVSNILLCTTVS
jgi:hypothetical protein